MVYLFFYNKLKDVEMINKISINNEIKDGYIYVTKYDIEKNCLLLGNPSFRNEIVRGKIVLFHLTFEQILERLNNMQQIRIPNKEKYNVELVDVIVYKNTNDIIKEKAYILY